MAARLCTLVPSIAPKRTEKEYLEAFNRSLTRIMSNKKAHVLVGGDFNCGNIVWSSMQVPEGLPQRHVQSQLLEIVQDHCLSQVVNIQTHEDKTLDLSLIKKFSLTGEPG